MQSSTELASYLADCIGQLDAKLKEFKSRVDTKKKKGNSKNDASKRSAEQVDDHKRMLQRLDKITTKDPRFESDNVGFT